MNMFVMGHGLHFVAWQEVRKFLYVLHRVCMQCIEHTVNLEIIVVNYFHGRW